MKIGEGLELRPWPGLSLTGNPAGRSGAASSRCPLIALPLFRCWCPRFGVAQKRVDLAYDVVRYSGSLARATPACMAAPTPGDGERSRRSPKMATIKARLGDAAQLPLL